MKGYCFCLPLYICNNLTNVCTKAYNPEWSENTGGEKLMIVYFIVTLTYNRKKKKRMFFITALFYSELFSITRYPSLSNLFGAKIIPFLVSVSVCWQHFFLNLGKIIQMVSDLEHVKNAFKRQLQKHFV